MVVDVDGARHRVDQARLRTHPRGTRAIERNEDALREVRRTFPQKAAVGELEEPVLARER
jgi:hypothetical protein